MSGHVRSVFLGIGTPKTVATKIYGQPYTIKIVLKKNILGELFSDRKMNAI
jgi:hypothetical protein